VSTMAALARARLRRRRGRRAHQRRRGRGRRARNPRIPQNHPRGHAVPCARCPRLRARWTPSPLGTDSGSAGRRACRSRPGLLEQPGAARGGYPPAASRYAGANGVRAARGALPSLDALPESKEAARTCKNVAILCPLVPTNWVSRAPPASPGLEKPRRDEPAGGKLPLKMRLGRAAVRPDALRAPRLGACRLIWCGAGDRVAAPERLRLPQLPSTLGRAARCGPR
jgi:hypothetical protein